MHRSSSKNANSIASQECQCYPRRFITFLDVIHSLGLASLPHGLLKFTWTPLFPVSSGDIAVLPDSLTSLALFDCETEEETMPTVGYLTGLTELILNNSFTNKKFTDLPPNLTSLDLGWNECIEDEDFDSTKFPK